MRGQISLESKLGVGTKATFWIPFNKAPYQSGEHPLVDLGTIPDRLASDMSISRPASENHPGSGPTTPTGHRREQSSGIMSWPEGPSMDLELNEDERRATQILVVEGNLPFDVLSCSSC